MIAILMATFNGDKYICEQIESILSQTIQDFTLFINDDCSSDNTYMILKEYENKYPDKIKISQNIVNSGSAKHNFMKMMIQHKEEYIMLCDQDDIWLPNKIEITINKMKTIEKEYNSNKPILIHTDLKVVDSSLNEIMNSYMKMTSANYNKIKLKDTLVQNNLTGCTAMYNKALAQYIKEEPKFFVMHDWWLMLLASAFGTIGTVYEQTILYRQHNNNSIGAKNMQSISFKLKFFMMSEKIKNALENSYKQANAFLDIYKKILSLEQYNLVNKYCCIPKTTKLKRIFIVLKYKTLKNGLSRIIGQLFYI